MPWVAVRNEHDDVESWAVLYEAEDCRGTKGYVGMIDEEIDEQTARTIAQRLNG